MAQQNYGVGKRPCAAAQTGRTRQRLVRMRAAPPGPDKGARAAHGRFMTSAAPCCFKAPVRREGQRIVTRFQLMDEMEEDLCSEARRRAPAQRSLLWE